MKKYKNHTLEEYLNVLSQRTPVPGGGSAAALVGSLGAALISMVANYSIKPNQPQAIQNKIQTILKKNEAIRLKLLEMVDLDAEAYLRVVEARRGPDISRKKKTAALRQARAIPNKVCRLCYKALALTPFLVVKGNRYLLSDVKVAIEFLLAAYQSAKVNIEINQ